MKNKKFEKLLVKASIAAAISTLLGFIYKVGERTSDKVDEKYEREHGVKPSKLF